MLKKAHWKDITYSTILISTVYTLFKEISCIIDLFCIVISVFNTYFGNTTCFGNNISHSLFQEIDT